MTDMNQIQDQLNLQESDMKALPQMLNVLTILTYIGSGLGILLSILGYFGVGFLSGMMSKVAEENQEAVEALNKVSANLLPLTIVSIIACILCFYGAMQMRNLKKNGFYIYCAGQAIGIIGAIVFSGSFIFGLIVAGIFIALYATNLKYLTK
jgi:uncharacterized BrkB/YihY/UPF0761 family membrane protein